MTAPSPRQGDTPVNSQPEHQSALVAADSIHMRTEPHRLFTHTQTHTQTQPLTYQQLKLHAGRKR